MKLFALDIDFDPHGLNHKRWSQDPGCDTRSYLSFPLLFFPNSIKSPPQILNLPLSHIILSSTSFHVLILVTMDPPCHHYMHSLIALLRALCSTMAIINSKVVAWWLIARNWSLQQCMCEHWWHRTICEKEEAIGSYCFECKCKGIWLLHYIPELEDVRERNHAICIQIAKTVLVVVPEEVTVLSAYRFFIVVLEDAKKKPQYLHTNWQICLGSISRVSNRIFPLWFWKMWEE